MPSSSNQTHLTYNTNLIMLLPQIPFCNPPKMWSFWGFLFGQIFITNNRKGNKNLLIITIPIHLSLFKSLFPTPFSHLVIITLSSFCEIDFFFSPPIGIDLMSKKMKRVDFDSSPHVLYEDARARFKHQTLLQDFLELQQETEDARNKLMALKQKKLTLQSEVRFLRQRHKFLLKEKSSSPQEQVFAKPQPTQFTKSKKEINSSKKQTTIHKLPPTEKKKKTPRTIPSPEFHLNLGISLHGVKEQSIHRGIANQRVRINGPKVSPFLDLTQKNGQEHVVRTQKPVIDLNQISREEEELQERWDPFNSPTRGLVQSGVGSGSGSIGRGGKRKISWQDPVA